MDLATNDGVKETSIEFPDKDVPGIWTALEDAAITRFVETVFGLSALTARDANSPALLLAPPPAPDAGPGGCH